MIKKISILGTPSKDKLGLFVTFGVFFFSLGIIDTILYSFFDFNITSNLQRFLNYFTPILFGFKKFRSGLSSKTKISFNKSFVFNSKVALFG